jgi:hypothetical protein
MLYTKHNESNIYVMEFRLLISLHKWRAWKWFQRCPKGDIILVPYTCNENKTVSYKIVIFTTRKAISAEEYSVITDVFIPFLLIKENLYWPASTLMTDVPSFTLISN